MPEPFEYTEEYLTNKKRSSGKNRYKSTKLGMRKLINHIFENEYLHPEQIRFIAKNALQNILWFEEEALAEYDSLPPETKARIEAYYDNYLKFRKENTSMLQESVDKFYERQREIYSETKELVEETIKGTTES